MLYGSSYLRLAIPPCAARLARRAFARPAQRKNAASPAVRAQPQAPERQAAAHKPKPVAVMRVKKTRPSAAARRRALKEDTALILYMHAWGCGVPVHHDTARNIIAMLLTQPGDKSVPVRSLLLALGIVQQQARHPDGADITMDCLPLVAALASQTAMPDRAVHIQALLRRVGDKTLCLDIDHSRLWRLLRKVFASTSYAEAIQHLIASEAITPKNAKYVFKLVCSIRFDSTPTMPLDVLVKYLVHLRRDLDMRHAITSVLTDYIKALSAHVFTSVHAPDAKAIQGVFKTLRLTERAVEHGYSKFAGPDYRDAVKQLHRKIAKSGVNVQPRGERTSR